MEAVSRAKDSERDVRERLLMSATELFAQKGYAATAVREIVAAAGVTAPVLYYYFGNKEGLFLELMREAGEDFDRTLEDSLAEAVGAREKILLLSRRLLGTFQGHIRVARVMNSIYYGPPQGAPYFDFESYHTKFRGAIRRLVEQGIEEGEFRSGNAQEMAWAVLGAINIATEVELCHPKLSLGPEGLARVIQMIFRGLEAADPRREEEPS